MMDVSGGVCGLREALTYQTPHMSHKRPSGWSGRSDDKRPRREPSDGEKIIKLLRYIDARLERMERQGHSPLSS